jgi:hypothetical protein
MEAKMLKFKEFITRSNQHCQADKRNDAKRRITAWTNGS